MTWQLQISNDSHGLKPEQKHLQLLFIKRSECTHHACTQTKILRFYLLLLHKAVSRQMSGTEIRSNMHFSRREKHGKFILTKQGAVSRNTGRYSANGTLTSSIPAKLQVCLLHNAFCSLVF